MKPGSVRLSLWMNVILWLIFLFGCTGSVIAQQTSSEKHPESSPASIEKLLQDLEDPQQLEKLKQDLRTLLAAQRASAEKQPKDAKIDSGLVGQLLSIMSDNIQDISQVLFEVEDTILEVPSLINGLTVKARDREVLKSWAEMLAKVALILLAGFLAQWLIRRLLSRVCRTLQDRETYSKGLRILFLIGGTILEFLPVAAFAAIAYGLLPLLEPGTGTQLAALTLINAIILVRIVLILAQLVLVPESATLRLLPLENESLYHLYIWVRRVAVLGVYGYFILEAALLLGLPESLYTFLLKILGLIITAMAVVLILQNRSEASEWLRGDEAQPEKDQGPDTEIPPGIYQKMKTLKALRRKLADFWHIAAIVLLLGIFGTWVLEIEEGFHFLSRALILTIIIIALASFLISLSMRGINHLFKICEELRSKYPELEARSNRYLPILNNTIKAIICIIAVFSILQAWGLDSLSWLLSPQGQDIISNLFIITLITAGAFLLWEIVSIKIKRSLANETKKEAGKEAN